MQNIKMLLLGLILGVVAAGGYMYGQVGTVTQQKVAAEQAGKAALDKVKDIETKLTSATTASGTFEKSAAALKAQVDKLMGEKSAAEAAAKTSQADIASITAKLAAAETASKAAEGKMTELRDSLAKAISAREAAEKALAAAPKQ